MKNKSVPSVSFVPSLRLWINVNRLITICTEGHPTSMEGWNEDRDYGDDILSGNSVGIIDYLCMIFSVDLF